MTFLHGDGGGAARHIGTDDTFFPPPTRGYHNVGGKPDTYSKTTHIQLTEDKVIQREQERWIKLFCDPEKHPRDVIGEQAGYKDKTKVKQALNETINGSKLYGKLRRWMEEQFPSLYKIWSQSDVKKTGPQISKLYETRLMLDEGLYRSADKMGIKLSYEYDGVGVFASEDHEGLQTQLKDLKRQITTRSDELWGIPVVVNDEVLDL